MTLKAVQIQKSVSNLFSDIKAIRWTMSHYLQINMNQNILFVLKSVLNGMAVLESVMGGMNLKSVIVK